LRSTSTRPFDGHADILRELIDGSTGRRPGPAAEHRPMWTVPDRILRF
jgi:hypothetical protein